MHTLSSQKLAVLLDRRRALAPREEVPVIELDELLSRVLEKANDFVPSVSGSILLDDPRQKLINPTDLDLVFVCCFGPRAMEIVGERIPCTRGIAGMVYQKGVAIMTNDTASGPFFDESVDKKYNHSTQNLLCVPIFIGQSICGVIELVNKLESRPYTNHDRKLVEIFAGYISTSFQNILDARQISRMVHIDHLTGLFNSRYLYEKLKGEISAAQHPLSLLFLDLDHFKKVNDAHGHLAGSALLSEYSTVLREAVGDANATLARYGGDEFIILLLECCEEKAVQLAQAIREKTEAFVFLTRTWGPGTRPLMLSGQITVSIGATSLPSVPATSADSVASLMISQADRAMYEAKSRGRNQVHFLPCLPAQK
jgi:diguanylate cyclase (GGDEF)-like protein